MPEILASVGFAGLGPSAVKMVEWIGVGFRLSQFFWKARGMLFNLERYGDEGR